MSHRPTHLARPPHGRGSPGYTTSYAPDPLVNASLSATYDHVYAYAARGDGASGTGGVRDAAEWCARAQLAQHAQYRALFEGFLSRLGDTYTAVVLWKSQSPWPALRGFLYDWCEEWKS